MNKELHTYSIRLAAPDTEWCHPFIQAMANRMAVSFHKYGSVCDHRGDCLGSANLRVDHYQATGNPEDLVDAANFLMMEAQRHWDAFRATDSDESPGRVWMDGSVNEYRNDDVRHGV